MEYITAISAINLGVLLMEIGVFEVLIILAMSPVLVFAAGYLLSIAVAIIAIVAFIVFVIVAFVCEVAGKVSNYALKWKKAPVKS